jgi:hypothetical protein
MAETIVTLSGDDANLFKAMQRIMGQQEKTDAGWKKNSDSSKKATDSAVKDAERLEKENKRAADAMFREHKKLLESKESESRRAAQKEEAIARQLAFAETKAALKAADDAIKAAEKVADKKRKLAEQFEKANTGLGTQIYDKIAGNIDVATVAIGAFALGVKLVADEQQRIVDLQNEQLGISNKLAAAQQEATKNLVGTDPTAMKQLIEGAPQRIALDAKFSDLPALTKALGSSASIVGADRAETVVSAAAKLSSLTPDQLATTSSATADVVKATGVKDAREAMSLLLSAGSVARPENLPQLAGGAAKAINAGVVATSGTQSQLSAAKESAAIFAMLSTVDPKGDSSATATVQLIAQMRELFGQDKEASDRRDAKIDTLSQARERNLDQKDNLTAQIEIKTKQAAKFTEADNSPAAQSARLSLTNAQSSLERLLVSSASTDKQLAALEADRQAQKKRVDPGTTLGRLEAVSKDPKLREQVLGDLKGEAIFKPLFEGLVTAGSEQRKALADSTAAITTDVSVFENAIKTQDLTAPQKIARTLEESKAVTAVQQTDTSNAEAVAAIRAIRDDALKNTTLPNSTFNTIGSYLESDYVENLVNGPENVRSVASSARERLTNRIEGAEDSFVFRKPNREEQSQIDALKSQRDLIDKIAELAKLPGALDRMSALLEQGNKKVDEQTVAIKDTAAANPNPNAIRAQAAAGAL